MTLRIDLNSDMGESFGVWKMGNDEAILPFVSSANIACGFHGGDPATMRKTVAAAIKNGVALGAHPGLPDLQGFGRRNMAITDQEAYDMMVVQIGALAGVAASQGARLRHVKAHGQLYNMAVNNEGLTRALAQGLGRPSTAWRRQRWSAAVGLSLAPAQRKLHAARPWCNLYLCPPDAVRRSAAQAAPRNGALCPKGHRLQHATSIDSSSTSWCPRVDATPRAVGDVPR